MTRLNTSEHLLTVLVMAGLAASLAVAFPSHAQTRAGASGSQPVCLTLESAGQSPFSVIVPREDAGNLEALGYKRQPCRDAFGSREAIAQWREEMCELAAIPLEDVQRAFEARLRVRSQQLCGMAELIAGRWQRKKPS